MGSGSSFTGPLPQSQASLHSNRDFNAQSTTASFIKTLHKEVDDTKRTALERFCDTCTKLLHLIISKRNESFPFTSKLAELDDEPPVGCYFCCLRWRMMPCDQRQELYGCQNLLVKLILEETIVITYLDPTDSSSVYDSFIHLEKCK